MYEYTGTAWITYLGNSKPITDPLKQWQAVRDADLKNGITWLPPSALNNTYALAMNQANFKKYGTRTLSEVAALAKKNPGAVTLCVESEFANRADGLPGMEKAYGMNLPAKNITQMDTGIIYTQVKKGSCTYGEVFTTDGRIKSMNLAVMADDRKFFPNYNAAPEINTKALKKWLTHREGPGPGDEEAEQHGGADAEREGGRRRGGSASGGAGLDEGGGVGQVGVVGASYRGLVAKKWLQGLLCNGSFVGMQEHEERKRRHLDARSLRGLAHPLRMQLLDALRNNGPATASQLGARLGESSGATSYHLRQLAAHGFVEDAPGTARAGSGGGRRWTRESSSTPTLSRTPGPKSGDWPRCSCTRSRTPTPAS